MAFPVGWGYYAPITISDSSPDYQTKVTVYEGSGTNGTDVVYCGGHCKSDFSDLRFTGSDFVTLLDYWIESVTGTTPNQVAIVHVQNNATPSTAGRMYYGNPDATAVSNIANTFIFGDDFDRADSGTVGNGWSETGDCQILSNKLVLTRSGSNSNCAQVITDPATSVKIEASMKTSVTGDQYYSLYFSRLVNYIYGITFRAAVFGYLDSVSPYWHTFGSFSAATYYRFAMVFDHGDDLVDHYVDNVLKYSDKTPYNAVGDGPLIRFNSDNLGGVLTIDWVFIRKWAATEPSFAFGSEETATIQLTITEVFKAGDTPVRLMTASVSVTEGLKGGDSFDKTALMSLLATDGLKGGDTPALLAQMLPVLSEGVKLGDTSVLNILRYLALTDGIKLGDSALAVLVKLLLLLDGLKAGDTIAAAMTASKILSEGINLGDKPGWGRHEYYTTGDDSAYSIRGSMWQFHTFTPVMAHKLTSVKLLLYALGYPGTLTVSIRATDVDGKPTGDDLCSGTTDGDTLPSYPYEWREISLGSGVGVAAGTKYAIVCRALEDTDYVGWRVDTSSGTYPSGSAGYSNDGGVNWSVLATQDFMFEEYGTDLLMTSNRSLSETIKLGDLSTRLAQAAVSLAEGLKFGDTELRGIAYYLSLAEGLKLGDAELRTLTAILQILDGLKLGDSPGLTTIGLLLMAWALAQSYYYVTTEAKPYFQITTEAKSYFQVTTRTGVE